MIAAGMVLRYRKLSGRGENIAQSMRAAPPLVSFALGALYQRLGDHDSAVKHLSRVVDEDSTNESAIVFPTKELREYVQMLRKIERAPAEAPLTSAAVRSLERLRKNKGKEMLEHNRSQLANTTPQLLRSEQKLESVVDMAEYRESEHAPVALPVVLQENDEVSQEKPLRFAHSVVEKSGKESSAKADRKSISEVLHDVYDKNIQ